MPLRTAGCTPPATRARRSPKSDTLVDALERGRRVAACHGKRLAAVVILPGPEARRLPGLRVPYLVFPASSSCRSLVALPERVARRGKFLGAPWLAFQASSSCQGLGLSTLFLNGLQGNHGGSWRSPGKPCRGALQLPVHKFGVLGYPYSSTPTGAPGPGPDTVPSAVGPGPRQGTGTRGLGHAKSCSVSTALSHNGTR